MINIGIIGYGKMGKIREKTVRETGRAEVRSVYEPTKIECSNKLPIVGSSETIIADPFINAVFICTPNYLNKQLTISALLAGKHVFCEKPPGINSQETLKMIEAEKKNPGLKLMFGFNHRHHDSLRCAKKIIDSGKFGKVLWMRGRYGKSVNSDFANDWRSKRKYAGGGIFLDQGIHLLDLFLMMCGDFQEVKSFVSNLYWKSDIEDNVFLILRNKEGQVASLHSTMTQWRHLFSFEIFLEKGHIVINGLLTTSGSYGQEQLTVARNFAKGPAVSWNKEEKRTYNINTSWENEIKVFLKCIKNNLDVPVGNSKDAYKLMKLVDKVYDRSGD